MSSRYAASKLNFSKFVHNKTCDKADEKIAITVGSWFFNIGN